MADDERAAWMTPPPELVRGCDSPEGVRILADWLDEHGGDGDGFRELQRDGVEQPFDYAVQSYGNGYGEGDGYGMVILYSRGDGHGTGHDSGTWDGDGYGYGVDYGTVSGDGGPDAPDFPR